MTTTLPAVPANPGHSDRKGSASHHHAGRTATANHGDRTMKRLTLATITAAALFAMQAHADHFPVRDLRLTETTESEVHGSGPLDSISVRFLPPARETNGPNHYVHLITARWHGGVNGSERLRGNPSSIRTTAGSGTPQIVEIDINYRPNLFPGTDHEVTITTYPSWFYGYDSRHPTAQSITVRTPGIHPFQIARPRPVCSFADGTLTVTWTAVRYATHYRTWIGRSYPKEFGTEDLTATTRTYSGPFNPNSETVDVGVRTYVSNRHSSYTYCSVSLVQPPPPPPPLACTWEHRFNTFPAADSAGRGVLRLTGRTKGARVRIEAFDRNDGSAIHVKDLGNERLLTDTAVTLGAANAVERFAIEGDSGPHTLIVSHAGPAEGMREVTAMMIRRSGGTRQFILPDVVGHCEPTEPEAPSCTWEHRFNTFPPADSTDRGILRITARKKGARVSIEAFDRADGTGLTVQDLDPDRDRLESGSSVTLGAANTVERFAIEGDSGQHTLIVSHAEHVAGMRAVTAMMVRQSGGTSHVIHPDVVEHCEPTGTETTP